MYAAICTLFLAIQQPPPTTRWDFEDAKVGELPPGWVSAQTGKGKGSVWKIVEDKTAPKGPKVLAQTARSPLRLFNLCVAEKSSFRDLELKVAFKAVKGENDQGGGVVWRYQDADNYYIARINPLEDNYRLYKFVKGERIQLASKVVKVPAGEWHTLSIKHQGDRIECYLDGKKLLEAQDDTFTEAGKIGLWSKADAETYFDDMVVIELKGGKEK